MKENLFISRHIYHQEILWQRKADSIDHFQATLNCLQTKQKYFAALNISERAAQLHQLAERLTKNADTLAVMISEEVGRCLSECRAEIKKSIELIDYYTKLAPQLLAGKTIATQASLSVVEFEPLGVVLAVMPWNYPIWQPLRFAIPALCAGNACVVKPAPGVGRVSEYFFSLVQEALPFQAAFLANEDVECAIAQTDAFAFTGSAKTGRHLAALAGKHLKKSVLELGGSNAFIVLPDADIQAAAKDACYSRFRDAGQSCNAAKRIILLPEVAEPFIAQLIEYSKKLQVGNPLDKHTTLAALHLPDAIHTMQSFVDDAVNKGAKCLLGGENIHHFTYPATILDCVPLNSQVAQEEVFGPVAAIFRAENIEHAISLANDTPYGLGAAVYGQNTDKAWRVAKALNVGSVHINRHSSSDLRLPFGGVKDSGYGRELSEFGIYEFVNIKSYWQK